MVGDDCPAKIKKRVMDEIDELEFVTRKDSVSFVFETLIKFYKAHKKEFKEWNQKKKIIKKK